MNHAIFMVFLVSSCLAMDSENPELYTGCRYAYFLEHKKLPAQDYELYEHCIKLVTFVNAIAKKLDQKTTHILLMQAGQTRQGFYLTSSTPPQLITPWGKWFTIILEAQEPVHAQQKEFIWQEVKKFIILGDSILESPSNRSSYLIYPILSFNDVTLPTPILRPYEEYANQFRRTKRTMATCTCNEVRNKVLQHLEQDYHFKKLTLQRLCIKTIKKHNLDISALPENLQKMIKK